MELERAILHEAPEPPHVRNPRVPQAMNGLCLRLLEKEPHARYPDARALYAALLEVKRGADETWKVPLREPGAAPATKDEPPAMAGRHPRGSHRGAVLAGGLVLLAAAWLSMFLFMGAPFIPREGTPRAALPREFLPISLELAGQEVAPPWKGPEGDGGAAPSRATTPAPVASATLAKDSQRVKTALTAPDLGQSMITVRGGPVTVVTMDDKGKLEAGSTLSGQLIIGKERVHGRLTEARTPRGDTFPVCFQFHAPEQAGRTDSGRGPRTGTATHLFLRGSGARTPLRIAGAR